MRLGKVLFIDTAHPALKEGLENLGFVCDYFPNADLDDFIRLAPDYNGFIVRSRIALDEKILPKALQLKFIGRVGAGMENIDVGLAEKLGIHCLNAPEGNRDAVGEQAIGMLLALMNRLLIVDPEVRQGVWKRAENRGNEIMGKTVAIIGFGNTGGAFARKLSGFGATLLVYDKNKQDFPEPWVIATDMERIFAEADILSLHVPLTSETKYLVNADYLGRFKKPIWFINTSRGAVVNTTDLMKGIDSGSVRGACLDVLEFEKFSFEDIQLQQLPAVYQQLIASNKVILSPHIAGWTHESNIKMAEVLLAKIKSLFGL